MRRILYVVNVDWFFVSHRLPLAISLLKTGAEVHIACKFTTYQDYFEELGIITHDLDLTRGGTGVLSEFKAFYSIYQTLKTIRPDLVHLVTIKPAIYGGIAARLLGVEKVVVSISGLGYVFIDQSAKVKFIRKLAVFFYRLGLSNKKVRVIFQNTTDRELFLENKIIEKSQAILIRGSGVDLHELTFKAESDGVPVVMFLARLLKDKGILEFVESSRIVKSGGGVARFVLVGDLDSENPNSISLQELNIWVNSGLVEHWGYSNDISATIAKSNLMVLPSYREGLPKSLLEAAACGRAVITSDVPGCRDAIVSGETGILVASKNAIALADAINQLLGDASLRRQYGTAGRELAENFFDIKDVVAKHLALYFGEN